MTPANDGYGGVAKALHWIIAAILVLQYAIGFVMPDIRRDMQPGQPMNMHISVGMVVLALIVIRFFWRLTHPVPVEPSLPAWQRVGSAVVHWLLYLFVFLNTLTGWFYASMRGWPLSFFGLFPLPALVEEGDALGRTLGRLHESFVFVLLVLIVAHVGAALLHLFVYRDKVMQRMLPGRA